MGLMPSGFARPQEVGPRRPRFGLPVTKNERSSKPFPRVRPSEPAPNDRQA